MSQANWEADKMLDVYIYDYLVKRNLQESAKAFQAEGKVSPDPVAIDAPGGFLFEWWSVFWDIFIARTNEKHSDAAASYLEKSREQQHPQHQRQPQQQQQQQIQMQQLLLQRHVQQQQQQHQQQQLQPRVGTHLLNGSPNASGGVDSLMRPESGIASALATKMYEEQLKLPIQRDSLDETSIKQRFTENVGQLLDPSHASILSSAATTGQPARQGLHGLTGASSGDIHHVQNKNQQFTGAIQDIKTDSSTELNPRSIGLDGTLIGVEGPNQNGSNLTLKGWPLTGLDQFRTGILQQQKSLMQSAHSYNQIQFLNPQQQQLLLQAQHNLASPLAGDLDSRRLRMLLNNRNNLLGKDGNGNSIVDIVSNVVSPLQATCNALPCTDKDMLIKKIAQLQQQQQISSQQQQLPQHASLGQLPQNSNPHQHDEIGAASIAVAGSMLNSYRGNDQASKSLGARKRKQPASSSGPANSSGTANTGGPSPSSVPSTPSTHTPADVVLPTLQHNNNPSKPLIMFGSADGESLKSPSTRLADIDHFVEDGTLDDNVETFLSHDDTNTRERVGHSRDVSKGFSFTEIGFSRASASKVVCCHFSSDGKLLATGGHDKKVVLWYSDILKPKSTLEEHSLLITDVRFSPSMPRLATSSFDKTVRIWDVDNPGYSLRTFMGHSATVMSLDFHPNKEDLVCSCDGDGEVRYWSITNGSCARVFKGGGAQMRFQPQLGRYLAAAAENVVSILDVETQTCLHSLQGHVKHVDSVCWDPSGEYVASVSEDSVKVWSLGSGSEGECVHELNCTGNKFHSCVFHPTYGSLLVIGCYQSLELWDMSQNKTMTLPAHEGLIASLAASGVTGLVASASHDKFIKLWR